MAIISNIKSGGGYGKERSVKVHVVGKSIDGTTGDMTRVRVEIGDKLVVFSREEIETLARALSLL
jgi:hypothetical protein